jgi:teichuronic acid biosynthesis glycosyltransferase TuaG
MTDAEQPFLAEAIRSAQTQTMASHIALCVEEANEWVDEVLAVVAPGVEVLRLPLAPLGHVRNTAIARLDCDLVAFLDGDDAWLPPKLERQVAVMSAEGLDIVGTKHTLVRNDGKAFFYAFAQNYPMPSSWLARTECLRDRRFPEIRVGEDIVVWDHLRTEARVGVLDEFLLRYRVRPGSLSQATRSMRRKRAYERRSHLPGMRYALLAASYVTNLGLYRGRSFVGGQVPHFRHA